MRTQALNLAKTHIVKEAWHRFNRPVIHGWVYGLEDGLIHKVCEITSGADIGKVFHYDFSGVPKADESQSE